MYMCVTCKIYMYHSSDDFSFVLTCWYLFTTIYYPKGLALNR